MQNYLAIYYENEKKINSIPNVSFSPPSSYSKEKSKFSKYHKDRNVSVGNFDEMNSIIKRTDSPIKSALKSSSRFESFPSKEIKDEENNNGNNNDTFGLGLERVSSKNFDDLEENKQEKDNRIEKQASNQTISGKNSMDEIPLNRLRRQSSVSKSLRLSYISRKKSFLALKETKNEEELEKEEVVKKNRLLFRQRRSNLIKKFKIYDNSKIIEFLCLFYLS